MNILQKIFKDNKSELFTPGFICVLHTFGRGLKWNPHEDKKPVTETVPVLDFIARLTQHIPEKHKILLPLLFFYRLLLCGIIQVSETEREAVTIKRVTEAEPAKGLQEQYIKHPPECMTSEESRDVSDDDLLDMDYFLHEARLSAGYFSVLVFILTFTF